MGYKTAICWSLIWVTLAVLYGGAVYFSGGVDSSATYFTCYFLEKLLSFDNLLMFYFIFSYFNLCPKEQARAFTIGIVSALVLRAALIFPGVWLVNQFQWLTYGFAAFLIYSSLQIFKPSTNGQKQPKETTAVINFISKHFRSASLFFVVVCVIELTDIMFSLDSIPASFCVTQHAPTIYAANLFAVLGLRSMYFLLLALIDKFLFLEQAVALILFLVGMQMLLKEYVTIPVTGMFAMILVIMATAIWLSTVLMKRAEDV